MVASKSIHFVGNLGYTEPISLSEPPNMRPATFLLVGLELARSGGQRALPLHVRVGCETPL